MDENEYKKLLKQTKIFLIILAIIVCINAWMIFQTTLNMSTIVGIIIDLALIILTYKGSANLKMYGPICGIILSIFLIITGTVPNIILGIAFILDCKKIIKYIKQ